MIKIGFLFALPVLAIGLSACQKLPEPPPTEPGVPQKSMGMVDAIPLEYGELIGVTQASTPAWTALFFQRSDKSIVAVFVNAERGIIYDKVVDIPRR